jgi:23S rRNA (cytidine1920-2'-O)/16S rRNA (cytidine1409-2'-O)-methyltransferase
VTRRLRLDAELVRRGLARSRDHASDLISSGHVSVAGARASKASTQVTTDVALVVNADSAQPDYVSRGGHKLAAALARFGAAGLGVAGRQALDAGASTGGFSDVLLRAGASAVIAVDVGYGQLAWELQQHPAVTVMDRTNVRDLTSEMLPYRPGIVVADLSFISLTLVLQPLSSLALPDADLVLMVKPQFEVGRSGLGKGGVVRDPRLRAAAVTGVAEAAKEHGLGVHGVCPSPLPGPAGNVEYFLWFARGAPDLDAADVDRAVLEGPQ